MSSNTKNTQIILRNRIHNKKYKLAIKRAIKQFLINLQNDKIKTESYLPNQTLSSKNLSIVYQRIDKAVKRKILHKNTAARKKARLARMLK